LSHFGRLYRLFSFVCGRGAVYFMTIKVFDTDMVDKSMSLLEHSMTGTYEEYPYREFHGYRARVLLLVL
jgi:hypothetical protein